MPKIKQKRTRRYRAQFSMPRGLWDRYQRVQQLLAGLRAEVDFSEDFEKWFSKQLELLELELTAMQATNQEERDGNDHQS